VAATTKAADLRTRLDLLLSERVMLIAKQAVAAGRATDEYPGYVALLSANAADLQMVFAVAFGNTAASGVGDALQRVNTDLVGYTIGLVTHKNDQVNAAQAHLDTSSEPLLVQELSSASGILSTTIEPLLAREVSLIEQLLADVAAQSFSRLYADLHTAYAAPMALGDLLAVSIAKKFPDKFPGDPAARAATWRASLSTSLQEHAYLTTLATDAQAAGRSTEAIAAAEALTTSAGAVGAAVADLYGAATGQQAAQLWTALDVLVVGYAASPAGTTKASIVESIGLEFETVWKLPTQAMADQLTATLIAVDDQLARSNDKLAGDDRAAATGMQPIAEELVSGASVQS